MNTHRMNCNEAREKLPLYVGGDLDREILEALRAHLERCDGCHAQVQQAMQARRELVLAFRERTQGTKPELWSAIRARLVDEGRILEDERGRPVGPSLARSEAGAPLRARHLRWTRVLAPLAAAALVLFVLQLSGAFSELPGERGLAPAPAPRDGGMQVVEVPPARGALIRVQADEALEQPAAFRARSERGQNQAGDGAVSLTSFESDPWK